jgi:UDP-N-acetylglucosamine diphosphorylase/glucosamine-1-phosphate N-acetyltransferase
VPIVPILFEDHLIPSFRPLAWTLPLFEIRCGLFNTRERLELSLDAVEPGSGSSEVRGGLLGRELLAGLHTSPRWTPDPERIRPLLADDQNRILWLNGRLAPRYDIMATLLDDSVVTSDFAWFDENGLLAASLTGEQSLRVLESWVNWQEKAAGSRAWMMTGLKPDSWLVPDVVPGLESADPGRGHSLWGTAPKLQSALEAWLAGPEPVTLDWIWEIVPATPQAITADITACLRAARRGSTIRRSPYGLFPDPDNQSPVWANPMTFEAGLVPAGVTVSEPANFWTGPEVKLGPSVAVDTTNGPVILDYGVTVQPHVLLEGPLYVGPGSIIKAGARIYGDSSFGIGCRLAGEIAESTFGDFANKQHAGFIGHAVLGSWINLGAMTTCSDLKNNYGNIRVDLGSGAIDTGLRFVGLMMGDHAKTAIGTLFNTGTCVGPASNLFGSGMPPKWVGNFRWGGDPDSPKYAVDRALETAATVMERRDCRLVDPHRELFRLLAD